MQHKTNRNPSGLALGTWGVCLGAAALVGCGDEDSTHSYGSASQPLVAECVAADAELPPGVWTCPEELSVECTSGTGTVDPEILYVREQELACAGQDLSVTPGPFGVGDHGIVVRRSDAVRVCTTELHVTDSVAPTLTTNTLNLWPPNHKFHSIGVSDCAVVEDACRADLQAEFIWASSDEPVDDLGDGHHAPDILVGADCKTVQLRAERQGPKDGRVYKLGVRVVDGDGNATEGVCTVIVDHDQRGVVGADSGEKYRILLNGQGGQPSCDGENPPPTTPPVEPPPEVPPPVVPPQEVDAGPGPIVD